MQKVAICLAIALSLVSAPICSAQDAAPGKALKYYLRGKEISEDQYNAILTFTASFEDYKAGRYAVAEKKLRKAIALDPSMAEAHCNLGLVLSKLGQTDEAVEQLQQALQLDPGRAEPLATLAGIHQSLGKLDLAITEYKEFLRKFPQHALVPKAKALVIELDSELKKRKEIADSTKPGEDQSDYLRHTTWESMARWKPDRLPLKVFMPPDSEAKARDGDYEPSYGQAMRDAFLEWQSKSGDRIKFTYVDSRDKADIECAWTDNPSKVSRPSERGETNVAVDQANSIQHATIVILTCSLEGELRLPVNLIYNACLHEIGHSLGLLGHSPQADDIMFCSVPSIDLRKRVSDRDSKTLIALYEAADKPSALHLDRMRLDEKSTLNNEGMDIALKGDFKKAQEKFEASLRLDPNFPPARQNLAAILNNMALVHCQTGKFADAAACFKRAIDLSSNDPNSKKRAVMLMNYAFVLKRLNRGAEANKLEAQARAL